MASIREVCELLQQVVQFANRMRSLLAEAADNAEAARDALAVVAAGSSDPEYALAGGHFHEVVGRSNDLYRDLGVVVEVLENYVVRLLGSDDPASGGAEAAPLSQGEEWGRRQLARLPSWQGGRTVGRYLDRDGISHDIVSGREEGGLDARLNRFLQHSGITPPWMPQQESTKHVEMKVAFMLRESREQRVHLVVNKPVCADQWGCDKLLPYVLKPGQSLIITDPTGTYEYRGAEQS